MIKAVFLFFGWLSNFYFYSVHLYLIPMSQALETDNGQMGPRSLSTSFRDLNEQLNVLHSDNKIHLVLSLPPSFLQMAFPR